MIEKNMIFWDDSEYLDEWISRMNMNGTFADHYAIQVVANLLCRDIIIIPTKPDSAHFLKKYCLIKAAELKNQEPIYVLWFEEYIYGTGHYQSIEPITKEQNNVLDHYTWLLKNVETSRIASFADSTVLGCGAEINRIASVSDFSHPLFNSSEQIEEVSVNSQSKYVKKGCHVCQKPMRKRKLCKKCQLFGHFLCIDKC